ncbi:glycosyltransferase [Acholeplasma hippikon]|uniref:Glycogen synthase n=1 Tax=Acholeplasma hippikon TaxID=264636 RepID=A0A449BLH2_9MOLU|nr:glycosyltransferase [Acholeplasma hippikon]VEU83284.1 Glycogen synthase [Acholeplasma hippikon]
MKILFIINALTIGGAERLVTNLALHMKNEKHDVELLLLSNRNSSELINKIEENNIKVSISKYTKVRDIRNYLFIKKQIKNNQYDVIHVHLFPALYYVSLLKRRILKNAKLIYTEHSTDNKRRSKKILRKIEINIYKKYDGVIAISKAVKKTLNDWLDHKVNIEIIENGIPTSDFSVKKEFRKNNKIRVGMVSRFAKSKDHLTLVRAMKYLPNYYELYFAGEGETFENVKKEVFRLGLQKKIQFKGNVVNVNGFLNECDIYVQSSNWEGFGLSVVEAMAVGLPIIASNVPGLSETVLDSGLLFEKSNVFNLVDNIRIAECNLEFYSNKAYERSKFYDISRVGNEHLKYYKNIKDKKI